MTHQKENSANNTPENVIASANDLRGHDGHCGENAETIAFWKYLFSQKLPHRLKRLAFEARLYLFWERFWPVAQIPLIISCFYVALSFLGVWQLLGFYLSAFGSIALLAGFMWSCYPLLNLKLPDEAEGLRKVEIASDLLHRPLLSYNDEQATGTDDEAALALWAVHQKRLRERLKNLRVGGVNPRGFTKDPYGLRVLAVMLLVVGYSISDANRWSNLLLPFQSQSVGTVISARIDAWITPPPYTGEAPVFLSGDANQLRDVDDALSIASGSEVLVRAQGTSDFSVVYFSARGQEFVEPEREQTRAGETSEELKSTEWRFPLNASGRLQILQDGSPQYSWKIAIRPDLPPRIRLFDDPEEQLSGSLKLTYLVQDDYRVVSAEAIMEKVQRGDANDEPGRSLVEAPRFNLSLPPKDASMSVGQTYQDLTAHPWAGSEVALVLVARDEAEQEGRSQPVYIKLPERRFNKPLARAVVEQRRKLAMNVESYPQVVDALDMVMIAPERFINDAGSYLPLRFAYSELVAANTDEQLTTMLDVLWNVALTIEDGGLSAAERALREAQEALRRALEQGASEQEIAELMSDLRKALDNYLKSMAQQMKDNPQQLGQMPMNENAQQITPRDLDDMLRRMEELAKTGSLEAARELLAQMQQMLENMQNAQQQPTPSEQQRQMLQALEGLGDMIEKQRNLMDETHKFDPDGQNPRANRPNGKRSPADQMSDEEAEQAFRQLQRQQRNLSDELQKLLDSMANNGAKPSKDLDSAGNSMEEAGEALGAQQADEAVSEQSQALESLRKGAQSLAEQLAGQNGGRGQSANAPLNEDPLGRMRRVEGPEFGSQVKVPDEIEVQRARRILEELRRRLSDPERPQLELEYLERLMKRY
ncbi:hypothetical protein PsAD2_01618 [Pseudovibrio axinellae]|uniref:TIGR02302 family protein n=1 Tax=Pseudovibrio axinellae TaxID=989403 RepID=A0A165ZPW5_9HYPH|nr:TIGR02302 family protein [Pseudovibrio axinellae]KZL20131.1 hypothetical protein PsAD2_01618 [Pseudovibrio axinellae]SEQ24019.1 TIGR02302 family protein [Pseudovibrio axinellae]